jgi:molecular chaperone GrpE
MMLILFLSLIFLSMLREISSFSSFRAQKSISIIRTKPASGMNRLMMASEAEVPVPVTSRKIEKLNKEIDELNEQLLVIENSRKRDQETLKKLEDEYGSEIERVKKEFARIKERSFEEARELTKKAKVDAIKEILPVTDNFMRAKQVYNPLQTETEKKILEQYETLFASLNTILEDFGATRVVSVGQPFDYAFMEAIMASPSNEYPPDVVMSEYQVGYKMGDKCIRPAIVVVSTGPGP